MNDAVRRVLAGDRSAFREIVEEHGPSIGGFIAAYLPQRDVVEDLAQETFIAAFAQLARFRPGEELGPWLKAIARHKVLSHLRSHYRRGAALDRLRTQALEKVADELGRAQEGDDARGIDRLRRCLDKLPARLREAIRARYYERRRVTAIAQALGATAAAVSSLLFRGRKELESCMEKSP
jgi:RNA polymerase sigma-70 factor (ECF subfamily)